MSDPILPGLDAATISQLLPETALGTPQRILRHVRRLVAARIEEVAAPIIDEAIRRHVGEIADEAVRAAVARQVRDSRWLSDAVAAEVRRRLMAVVAERVARATVRVEVPE